MATTQGQKAEEQIVKKLTHLLDGDEDEIIEQVMPSPETHNNSMMQSMKTIFDEFANGFIPDEIQMQDLNDLDSDEPKQDKSPIKK